ncbi:sodium/solute symporter, partial [Candidatus Sumerlaeota bacterium]|nr:sodium/solute symporter [Candidatus Sumerlaeota bacterium]
PSGVLKWEELPELPPAQGQSIPHGLAGAFSGIHNNALIIAGGANFPDGAPWEGGKKAWHDDIYVLEKQGNGHYEWRAGFKLPTPLAYGASISTPSGLVCIGGCDALRCYPDVFIMKWDAISQTVSFENLPSLPSPCAFASAAKSENTIYVAGGQSVMTGEEAMKNFWSLDLVHGKKWETLPSWDGAPRILSILAAQNGGTGDYIYLFSGRHVAPKMETQLLKDVHRFDPAAKTWKRLSDAPRCLMAGSGAAFGANHILLIGGDDGGYWGQDLRNDHPGFPRDMAYAYHTLTDTWANMGELPQNHVTTNLISWENGWVIPSGEIRPAVRTPKILKFEKIKSTRRLAGLDYLALIAYLLSLIGMGFYFSKRENTTDDFFLAGRRVPWWAAGLSIFGTQLSAITFMAIPAKAYATNWIQFLFNMGIIAIAPLIVYGFLPFFRRLNITSAYEYLEKRFNIVIRLAGSALFIIFQIGRIGIVLLLPSLALSVVTGMNVYFCILIMGILSTVYTVMGGIEAVIWTDVLQVFVLVGGALVCFFAALFQIDGGFSRLFSMALQEGKLHFINWEWDFGRLTIWVIILSWINALIPYASDQAVIQRYLTTKDEKSARRAVWTNAVLTLPATLLFFGIGTVLFVFYKSHPMRLDPGMAKIDNVFPWFIMRELPMGLSGLLIAGIFAASMSTLDSSMNSMSTAVVTDFYRRFKPNPSEKYCLDLARWLTAIFGLFGTVFAIFLASSDFKSLWDQFVMIIGLLGGGLGGLFVLGIFTKRANSAGAGIGLLFGGVMQYLAKEYSGLHSFLFAAIGFFSCIVAGYAISLFFPRSGKSLDGLTVFTLHSERSENK